MAQTAQTAQREGKFLTFQDVTVRYGEKLALDKASFGIERGSMTCVIGPNGAGKSTLLKTIAGLIEIESGKIESQAKRVGYVPQRLQIDSTIPLRVDEFLALKFSRQQTGFKFGAKPDIEKLAKEKLEIMDAEYLFKNQLGKLSGGEFQRVLIAYALLGDPDMLLLDEPLTGLDIHGESSFEKLLKHLQNEKKITLIMVSHDFQLVQHAGSRVLCVNRMVHSHHSFQEALQSENLEKIYGQNFSLILSNQKNV